MSADIILKVGITVAMLGILMMVVSFLMTVWRQS